VPHDAVATAADGELVSTHACDLDHTLYIAHVRDADDRGGPLVDTTIEDGSRLVVGGIVGNDHAPRDAVECVGRPERGTGH